jgi:serine-type D-Ala-D-Ala carboxypeptidase/endopeptidase (penicillin-binding protein 4)
MFPVFARCVCVLALCGAWLWGGAAWAQPHTWPPSVRQAVKKAGLPDDAVALLVAPVDGGGAPLLALGAQRPMNPASVMKLVTTYAAIDLLGPAHLWRTGFYVDGTVDQGLLRGNLHIRGGGDPKFVMERIADALQAVRDAGVTVVRGDIVLDQSAFVVPPADPAAFDGERLRPYNVAPEALLVNFKAVVMGFVPDPTAGMARVTFEPPLAGLAVDATVPLTQAACGDWRGGLQARFDDPNAIRFAGSYPARCGERPWPVAYVEPGQYAARALEGLWRAGGGLLTGSTRLGPVPPQARLLHEAPSLPLADIVADINKHSNNVMAQQVFLTLAASPATPATFERARQRVGRWWHARFGAKAPAPVMDNGSGLSRDERITADGLLALLRDAATHPSGEVLRQSLPVAGVDGTAVRMGERGVMKLALGNARIKTGSLRDVVAVAGYVQARNGRPLVVVGMVNHANAPQARPVMDALLEWAASQVP